MMHWLEFRWVLLVAVCALCAAAGAEELTISAIQSDCDADGASSYAGQVVDCAGGIVTQIFEGSQTRVVIQDPAFPDGWGGIQVKDWIGDLADLLSVGDWVSFANVQVEEYRGTTLLQYRPENGAGHEVLSQANELPPHKLVVLDEIAAPLGIPPEDPQEWYVADHSAEKYESMLLMIEGVTVTAMDLGKAGDNYNLHGQAGDVWASDYMNADRVGAYHPYVALETHFESVSGILEQYTKIDYGWDYYQVLTTGTSDLVIPEPASGAMLLAAATVALTRRRRRDFRCQ